MSRARINILIGLFTLHPHRCRHAGEHAGHRSPVSRRPQRNGQPPAVRSFFVRDAFLIAFVYSFIFQRNEGGYEEGWLIDCYTSAMRFSPLSFLSKHVRHRLLDVRTTFTKQRETRILNESRSGDAIY